MTSGQYQSFDLTLDEAMSVCVDAETEAALSGAVRDILDTLPGDSTEYLTGDSADVDGGWPDITNGRHAYPIWEESLA